MSIKQQHAMQLLSAVEQAERPMKVLAAALQAIGEGPHRLEFDKYDIRNPASQWAEQVSNAISDARDIADSILREVNANG